MKMLIISDIHSNMNALQAIWDQEKDSDIIYCAGDLVDVGLFPKQVIEWSRRHNIVCVKGNHDEIIIAQYRSGIKIEDIPEEQRNWVHRNAAQLDEDDIQYLENLPDHIHFTGDGIQYCMKHTFRKGSYETMANMDQFHEFWSEHADGEVAMDTPKRLIFGHTHNQAIHYLNNTHLWLNPGSVSYRHPRNFRSGYYMTIIEGQIQMKNVDMI